MSFTAPEAEGCKHSAQSGKSMRRGQLSALQLSDDTRTLLSI